MATSEKEEKPTMAQSLDQEVLDKAQQGDTAALGEIYDCYAPKIYSYILYQVHEVGLAEDLTSSVFTRVLRAIQSSNAWTTSFSSWLYRIAHNIVIDHYRKGKYEGLPLDEHILPSNDNPAADVQKGLESDMMREAMTFLTDDQRTVIALKFFEGFSNLEVAHVMGKTEGSIKSLQFRALASLRRIIEQQWGADYA
jgi:RNA polymerase sigma-70 factor, ECF subfamily